MPSSIRRRTALAGTLLAGTVLLARDGKVVFEAARGIADRNHGVPMRLDSKLNLGSMDKMFTAVIQAGRSSCCRTSTAGCRRSRRSSARSPAASADPAAGTPRPPPA